MSDSPQDLKKDDIFHILEHLRSISQQLSNVLDQNAILKTATAEALLLKSQLDQVQQQIDECEIDIKTNSQALENLPCSKHTEALGKLLAAINDPEKGLIVKIRELSKDLERKIGDVEEKLASRIEKHSMYWSIVYWLITAPAGIGIIGALLYYAMIKLK